METKYLKLLYNVLCARMPYHVMVNCGADICEVFSVEGNDMTINGSHPIESCKPMLRSMSRMTDKEREEYDALRGKYNNLWTEGKSMDYLMELSHWLLSHHFDYNGLIEMGLAQEASDELYNIECGLSDSEKQLMFSEMCARLPYGLMMNVVKHPNFDSKLELVFTKNGVMKCNTVTVAHLDLDEVRPYLRPLTTMTDDEAKEFDNISESISIVNYQQVTPSHYDCMIKIADMKKVQDWFAKKHFDTAGLIEKGLAVEAPEKMYKND